MQWSQVGQRLVEHYNSVATWVYNNPVETDVLIIAAVLFGIYKYTRRDVRTKRRHIRFVRGSWMSRQDRMNRQKMRFEDALQDAALNMIMSGEMSEAEEKGWYRAFAEGYGLAGLLPRRDNDTIKRGIRTRIWFYRNKLKLPASFAGGKPEVIPDKTYSPNPVCGLATSKYAKRKE